MTVRNALHKSDRPLFYIRPGDGCIEVCIGRGDDLRIAKLSPEIARLKAEDLLRIARKVG